jgi:hypothetical protein
MKDSKIIYFSAFLGKFGLVFLYAEKALYKKQSFGYEEKLGLTAAIY